MASVRRIAAKGRHVTIRVVITAALTGSPLGCFRSWDSVTVEDARAADESDGDTTLRLSYPGGQQYVVNDVHFELSHPVGEAERYVLTGVDDAKRPLWVEVAPTLTVERRTTNYTLLYLGAVVSVVAIGWGVLLVILKDYGSD